MIIHKGKNFVCCNPISLGALPFSFEQDCKGFYKQKIPHKDIIIGNDVFMNSFVIVEFGLYENTMIGDNCIIDGHVMIGHDVSIGKSVQLGTGVLLLGHVHVGDYTKIFANAVVNPKIKIGKNCIIGANSYVRHDVPDGAVAYGNPAKIIKRQIHYPRPKYD